MDCNKQTQETRSDYTNIKYEGPDTENIGTTIPIPFEDFKTNNQDQEFYKTYNMAANGQHVIKHGHKIFTISRSEQDLAVFCLSLLQFQAEFPLRFFLVDLFKKENDVFAESAFKDVWLETQFIVSSNTTKEGSLSKDGQLQKRVYRFFKQSLIPTLIDFKKQRINWVHMTSQNYTDQKVVNDFNQLIIKRINRSFKGYCSQV